MPDEKKFKISILRDQETIGLKLKAPKELEELFQKLSDETRASNVWATDPHREGDEELDHILNGAEFYLVNDEYEDIEGKITKRTFNDYGQGLTNSRGAINLAPLRTKGIKYGTEIYSSRFTPTNGIEIEDYAQKLCRATKKIMEEFLKEKEVNAELTIKL